MFFNFIILKIALNNLSSAFLQIVKSKQYKVISYFLKSIFDIVKSKQGLFKLISLS